MVYPLIHSVGAQVKCDRLSKIRHVCMQTEIHVIAPVYSYTK